MQALWEPLPEQLHSFPNFCCYLLREQGLATAPTKQQIAVADWMQNGPDRTLTVAFRGLGKSLLASYYALWRLRMDPEEKILVVSATAIKSTDFTQFLLRTMAEVDILQCLLPGPENRFSNVAFDVGPCTVEQSPSVRALGVTAQTTGQRCTCAILDDVETLSNVITQLKQERVAHAMLVERQVDCEERETPRIRREHHAPQKHPETTIAPDVRRPASKLVDTLLASPWSVHQRIQSGQQVHDIVGALDSRQTKTQKSAYGIPVPRPHAL